MALRGRDDDRARRLRRAIEHRRTLEFRVQFHGVVRQKSRLVADIRLLCVALRDRKDEAGRGNNHPDQVPKFGHPRLSPRTLPSEPSNLRDGSMESNPEISLEFFKFSSATDGVGMSRKSYFGASHSLKT